MRRRHSLPGDGCSGKCLVENYGECPDPGKPCKLTFACGDGTVKPGGGVRRQEHRRRRLQQRLLAGLRNGFARRASLATSFTCADGRVNGVEQCDSCKTSGAKSATTRDRTSKPRGSCHPAPPSVSRRWSSSETASSTCTIASIPRSCFGILTQNRRDLTDLMGQRLRALPP